MNEETKRALEFALGNSKSYDGVIDCKVVWDNLLQHWLLDCGEFSLMLSNSLVAMEVVVNLNKI